MQGPVAVEAAHVFDVLEAPLLKKGGGQGAAETGGAMDDDDVVRRKRFPFLLKDTAVFFF